ncbi:MAG: hypothetical protein ACI845_004341, partial [Gammaproteobacteria bacterium]
WPAASRQIGNSVRHRPDSLQAQQGSLDIHVHRANRMPYLSALFKGYLKSKENTTISEAMIFF